MHVDGRTIALEIRSRKFGFAVFEGSDKLLDWGVRSFGEDVEGFESTLSDRIRTLLAFYGPAALVIRDRELNSTANGRRVRLIIRTIKLIMKSRATRFYALTVKQVQDRFARGGSTTKHDIAKSLAERFEELSFKLPNKRKAYQSEAPAMLVFDAVATAIAFLERGNASK